MQLVLQPRLRPGRTSRRRRLLLHFPVCTHPLGSLAHSRGCLWLSFVSTLSLSLQLNLLFSISSPLCPLNNRISLSRVRTCHSKSRFSSPLTSIGSIFSNGLDHLVYPLQPLLTLLPHRFPQSLSSYHSMINDMLPAPNKAKASSLECLARKSKHLYTIYLFLLFNIFEKLPCCWPCSGYRPRTVSVRDTLCPDDGETTSQ